MRILVLEELTAEIALREQSVGIRNERQANERRDPADWHIFRVNSADARALDLAVGLKAESAGSEAVLLHLGPSDAETWMREELARGADRAIRVWDGDELAGARTQAKAVALAAAARTCGFDLILTGAANAASAGGQLGVLLAKHLGVPCVTQASEVQCAPDGGAGVLQLTRELTGGWRERVEIVYPAVVTVVAGTEYGRQRASTSSLIRALDSEIELWDLATLGIPLSALRRADEVLIPGELRPPRPGLRFIAAPDSSAPAFDRVLQIVAGVVKHREGRIVQGAGDVVANEVFESLRDEGWLDHLRS